MAEKISRKELKKPDELVAFTQRLLQWTSAQRWVLITGAIALVLVIVATTSWQWYTATQEREASTAFMKAKEVMNAQVISSPNSKGSSPVDGIYSSEAEKHQAALAELNQITKDYPSTKMAILSLYFIGHVHLRLGEQDQARKYLKEYLNKAGPEGEMAIYAMEGLGISYEAQSKHEEAAANYRRLIDPPYNREPDRGLYHLARLEEKKGRKDEARKYYNQVLREYPNTIFMQEIQQRLNNLPQKELKETPKETSDSPSSPSKDTKIEPNQPDKHRG